MTSLVISAYYNVRYFMASSSQTLQVPLFASTGSKADYIIGDDSAVLIHYPDDVPVERLMYKQLDLATELGLDIINTNGDDWIDEKEFDIYMKTFPEDAFNYRTINSYMDDLTLLFGESTGYQQIVLDTETKTIGFIYNEKAVSQSENFYNRDTGANVTTDPTALTSVLQEKGTESGIESNAAFYSWLIARYATSEGVDKEVMRDRVEILYTLTYCIASKMLGENFDDYKIIVGSSTEEQPYFMIEKGEVTLNNVM